jgi:hypothetical protein
MADLDAAKAAAANNADLHAAIYRAHGLAYVRDDGLAYVRDDGMFLGSGLITRR